MKEPANILVVDDDEDILITAEVVLKQKFSKVDTISHPDQISDQFKKRSYQVVLLDMNFSVGDASGKDGLKCLGWLHEHYPETQVVMITAHGELDLAVKAMKLGAADFVTKPWQYSEIQEKVLSAYKLSKVKKEVDVIRAQKKMSSNKPVDRKNRIIGTSSKVMAMQQMIEKVAPTDANVLILGENGTGKELVAQTVHELSKRNSNQFVSVDMGALTESLFESELFGHAKGAFTDAKEAREGRFEAASGGTIFLDEIGNLTLAMQSKLLSILQKRSVVRVGENKERPIDVRLLCATNMDLNEMVAEGTFRQDLLYRINTIELNLPSLRERQKDIIPLSEFFLKTNADRYDKAEMSLSEDAKSALLEYKWPGNIRELEHTIERAVIMSSDNEIQASDLLLKSHQVLTPNLETSNLEEIERRTIEEVINRCDGNMSKVAKELGIGRTTLYRKIEKYGLQ